jgi:hypothetical protein
MRKLRIFITSLYRGEEGKVKWGQGEFLGCIKGIRDNYTSTCPRCARVLAESEVVT